MQDKKPKSKDDYESLKKTWYAKLKKSGFVDAESKSGGLNTWSNNKFRDHNETTFSAKQDFYFMAGRFYYDHKFKSVKEKNIWKRYADGATMREIAKHYDMSKASIMKLIKELTNIMLKSSNKNEE